MANDPERKPPTPRAEPDRQAAAEMNELISEACEILGVDEEALLTRIENQGPAKARHPAPPERAS